MGIPQKLRCRVDKIIAHGDQVFTLELLPEHPAPRFKPGQFLHLAIDPYDPSGFWPESRAFSIASSPANRDRIRITYSVQGNFTARMKKELNAGSEVWIKMPYGEFAVDPDHPAVLIAGGTGITAFTAFIDNLTADYSHPVTLVYGARSNDLLIYREAVQERLRTVPQFRAFYFVEQGARGTSEISGRLSAAAIVPLIRQPLEAYYYLSGPPAMLKDIASQLKQQEIPDSSIRIDAWE